MLGYASENKSEIKRNKNSTLGFIKCEFLKCLSVHYKTRKQFLEWRNYFLIPKSAQKNDVISLGYPSIVFLPIEKNAFVLIIITFCTIAFLIILHVGKLLTHVCEQFLNMFWYYLKWQNHCMKINFLSQWWLPWLQKRSHGNSFGFILKCYSLCTMS